MIKLLPLALCLINFNCIADTFDLVHCPSATEVVIALPKLVNANSWVSKNKIKWDVVEADNKPDDDFSFRVAEVQDSHNDNDDGYVMNCLYYSDGENTGKNDIEYAQLLSVNTLHTLPSGGLWKDNDCNVEDEDGSLIGTEASCPFEINR